MKTLFWWKGWNHKSEMISSCRSAFSLLSVALYLKWSGNLERSLIDSSPLPGFLFLSPFSSFYCLTKAVEDFVECSFFGQRKWKRRSGAGREEVYLSERGWAVLCCRGGGRKGRGLCSHSHWRYLAWEWAVSFFLRGFEKFSSGELARNWAKHPGEQEHSGCLSRLKLRRWRRLHDKKELVRHQSRYAGKRLG